MLTRAAEAYGDPLPTVQPETHTVRVLDTPAELDAELVRLDEAAAHSDDALRDGFRRFRMDPPADHPVDPWSEEYRQWVLAHYESLSGRPYDSANEVTVFDPDQFATTPFPYSTRSAETVGEHYIAIGHLIRSMAIPPGSRILEMGFGWGNLTLALAQMGHDVTAVDIEQRFVELLSERARRLSVDVTAIHGDFDSVTSMDACFDAVVFFECFHHSSNHVALLQAVGDRLANGGQIYFAREPIHEDFHVPWGLRLDGESLWAIRRNGWFELGFDRAYFEETLDRLGWSLAVRPSSDAPNARVFVASRKEQRGPGLSEP